MHFRFHGSNQPLLQLSVLQSKFCSSRHPTAETLAPFLFVMRIANVVVAAASTISRASSTYLIVVGQGTILDVRPKSASLVKHDIHVGNIAFLRRGGATKPPRSLP